MEAGCDHFLFPNQYLCLTYPAMSTERMGGSQDTSSQTIIRGFSSSPDLPLNSTTLPMISSLQKNNSNNSQQKDLSKEEADRHSLQINGTNNKHKSKLKEGRVFLGGSCNPTTWRTDIAIPTLNSWGITYYNPQVSQWRPDLIQQEWLAKKNAEVLFFVIDSQTRGIVAMIESAFISGKKDRKGKLVLVFDEWTGPGAVIHGEAISEKEYRDLREGQSYLQSIVERRNIPIFDQIVTALKSVFQYLCEGKDLTNESLHKTCSTTVLTNDIPLSSQLIRFHEVFDSFDVENKGEISFTDLRHVFKNSCSHDREVLNNNLLQITIERIGRLSGSDLNHKTINLDEIRINFDDFYFIATEFQSQISTNGKFGECLVKKHELTFEPILNDWVSKPVNSALKSTNSPNIQTEAHRHDIYLGGSASQSSNWREDIAIPLLQEKGLTYYSSQSHSLWSEDQSIPIEKSRVLLFVITNNNRALSAMILAAHYIALGSNVVLCIQYLDEECVIDGEKMTTSAIKDYNRGRAYLSDMALRARKPVFTEISDAVNKCVRKCISIKNKTISQINNLAANESNAQFV